MPAPGSLTPSLALACLRELSVDVRSAVVLDAAGAPLAGDAELAQRAHEALRDGSSSVPAPQGTLLVARSEAGLAIAVMAGDRALLPLLEHDMTSLLGELAGG